MKRILILTSIFAAATVMSCEKADDKDQPLPGICADSPRSPVAESLRGTWMYGQFSLTEYWSTNPAIYLGNGLEMAIAFKFNADGTYEQYFTSSSVSGGVATYQQSVTKGTVRINTSTGEMTTYDCTAHYKRTRNGQTLEERDLSASEITPSTDYSYVAGQEPNGTAALYITLKGTSPPLIFLKKF